MTCFFFACYTLYIYYTPCILILILFAFSFPYHYVSIRLQITNDFVESGPKKSRNYVFNINLQIFVFLMLHPIYFFTHPVY